MKNKHGWVIEFTALTVAALIVATILFMLSNSNKDTNIVIIRQVTQTPVISTATPTVNPVPTPIRIYLIDSFEQKDWCFERDGLIERGKTDNGMLICRLPNPLPDIEKYKKQR